MWISASAHQRLRLLLLLYDDEEDDDEEDEVDAWCRWWMHRMMSCNFATPRGGRRSPIGRCDRVPAQ